MDISLYPHQEKCIDAKKGLPKSLINIWCGGGKTRIIVYSIFDDGKEVNVIVFPSLGLINQFNNDYILCEDFMDYFKKYHCLSVCSDSESKLKIKTDIIRYTTKESIIKSHLKKEGKKLFTVTYQSLEMFMDIILETETSINRLYYDEAHHILGHNIQNIVFKNDELNALIDKTEFYTATPDNKNGITMYDRENPENSDCGPIAYEYLFYQAVEDGISKDFTMKLMLYPKTEEDMYINLFESIFRECFSGDYDYWNILTFHNMVEEKDDMATVNQLSKKEKLFKKCFLKVIEEYPDKKSIYSVENVFLKGVGSKTRGREEILADFDMPEIEFKKWRESRESMGKDLIYPKKRGGWFPGRICLIASCKTLGEGIDTKYANMEIPINPGGSVVYEQQKLGRITRNPDNIQPNGIVLIPCWIDMDKYEGLDKYERDEMIRQELHEGGNFNTFLNVMSAYKNQCDPELWELCLKYPKMYSPKEIKDNLDKQGFKVDESKGDLIGNVNYIVDKDLSDLEGETDEETIQNIVSTGKQIEIHSQDKDLPIITYGSSASSNEEPIRLFKDEKDVYHPVSKKEPSEPKRKIERPDKLKRKKLVNVHMNDEIKVLWKIDPSSIDSIGGAFCHGVLDAEIEYDEKRFERWHENLEKVKKYIDKYNELPSKIDCCKIGISEQWIHHQIQNYKVNIKIMKNKEIRKKWEEFCNEYNAYFLSNEEIWFQNLEKVKKYIDENDKLPSKIDCSEIGIPDQWIHNQIQNYKQMKKNNKMKDEYIEPWENFIDEYNEYFVSNEELWYINLEKVKKFIDKNNKLPNKDDYKLNEITSEQWIQTQKKNHKNRTCIMKNVNIRTSWEEFISEYNDYLLSNEEKWYGNREKVKKFIDKNKKLPSKIECSEIGIPVQWISHNKKHYIKNSGLMKIKKIKTSWEEIITEYNDYFLSNEELWYEKLENVKEYIKKNNKRPSEDDKDKEIKQLGNWVSSQIHNYKQSKCIMENVDIRKSWEEFITEYNDYFLSNEEIWYQNLEKVKKFIDENKKLPWTRHINKLGNWISMQKQNYIKTKCIMKNIDIRTSWEEFTTEYNDYFLSNEEIWYQYLEKVKKFIDENKKRPSHGSKVDETKILGRWLTQNILNYTHNKINTLVVVSDTIKKSWEDFIEEYSDYFTTNKVKWFSNLKKVEEYQIKNNMIPLSYSNKENIDKHLISLGQWVAKQRIEKNKNKLPQEKIDLLEKIPGWYWSSKDKPKKDMSKKEIKPKSKKETTEQKRERTKSEISILHQKYKTMNSQTLHKHFEDNPDDWLLYHKISEENEETFPDEEIPYKKVIDYLENIPGKKKKDVADLGCGKARICEHFSDSERFKFINMDHVSCNDLVVKHDIKDTGLDDYSMDVVILSLAMWGSNCRDYITEANRILIENGVLLIIEATKRWMDEETSENKLVKLLEDNNFTIKNINEEKFMFIECIKN